MDAKIVVVVAVVEGKPGEIEIRRDQSDFVHANERRFVGRIGEFEALRIPVGRSIS